MFPGDKLPQTIDKNLCGFVANTDPSNKPGTHWVVFYFSSEHEGEFFETADYYSISLRNFLDKHSIEWDFNKRTLQSIWSDVCGQYCLFYLCQRARGHSLSMILDVFNNSTLSNDAKVFQFAKNHF